MPAIDFLWHPEHMLLCSISNMPKRSRARSKSTTTRGKRVGRRRRRGTRPRQLGLSARTRGGYRAGAGRPRGRSDRYVPHIRRPKVTRSTPVHVTLKCVEGIPSLRRLRRRRVILKVFAEEGARKGFRLVHYSIRGDHIHLVCEANETLALSRGVQRVASRIARLLNKQLGRRGRFFADRFHGRVVRTPKDMRNVLSYVLLNLHKDEAKRRIRVLDPDSFSSHRWFDGWKHGRSADKPDARDPVTEPRSWLLTKGWRRHGLIDLDERRPRGSPR
jgi:REP element-mobilizing transposase RayT